MKQKLLFGLLLIALSCSESYVNPKLNDPKLTVTVLEQVANQLTALGHSVMLIDEIRGRSLLISSSLSRTHLAIEINRILIQIAHPEQQFIIHGSESVDNNTRTEDVQCNFSDWYDSGGARCTNWLCIADTSYSNVSGYDCFGSECFRMYTSCFEE